MVHRPRGARRSLRPPREIQRQLDAARAYAPVVVGLEPTSHRYTAGQAATLAWLVGVAGDPLPTNPGVWPTVSRDMEQASGTAAPTAADVRRLKRQTNGFLGSGRVVPGNGEGPGVLNHPYLMGVAHVCDWVLRDTPTPPFRVLS
jgi:hypothetical protein